MPPAPTPTAPPAILDKGPSRIVPSGVSVCRTATMRTQKEMIPATKENALSTWSTSIQSSKLTR